MIRPFDLRDVSLIQRLAGQARPLALEWVAVEGVSPLREAMRAYLSRGHDGTVVLVERSPAHGVEAFGLMQTSATSGEPSDGSHPRGAVIVMMSPRPDTHEYVEAWGYLVHEFVVEAAARGLHHIVAEAAEGSSEWLALHAASFAPLIQQDVLKLSPGRSLEAAPHVPGLREQTKDDEPGVRALHARLAPKMTYHAELSFDALGASTRRDHGFVFVHGSEMLAHIAIHQGRRGYGLQLRFRPEAEPFAESILRCVLAHHTRHAQRPVYVTVRQHHSWLLPILDRLGFTHIASNVLMVRHIARHVQQPVWSQTLELETATVRRTHPASYELPAEGARSIEHVPNLPTHLHHP